MFVRGYNPNVKKEFISVSRPIPGTLTFSDLATFQQKNLFSRDVDVSLDFPRDLEIYTWFSGFIAPITNSINSPVSIPSQLIYAQFPTNLSTVDQIGSAGMGASVPLNTNAQLAISQDAMTIYMAADRLYTIDPETGVATAVGPVGFGQNIYELVSFPSGATATRTIQSFLIRNNGDAFLTGSVENDKNRLYSLDLTTGMATPIGSLGYGINNNFSLSGLSEIPESDIVYGIGNIATSGDNNLYTMNVTTGELTRVDTAEDNLRILPRTPTPSKLASVRDVLNTTITSTSNQDSLKNLFIFNGEGFYIIPSTKIEQAYQVPKSDQMTVTGAPSALADLPTGFSGLAFRRIRDSNNADIIDIYAVVQNRFVRIASTPSMFMLANNITSIANQSLNFSFNLNEVETIAFNPANDNDICITTYVNSFERFPSSTNLNNFSDSNGRISISHNTPVIRTERPPLNVYQNKTGQVSLQSDAVLICPLYLVTEPEPLEDRTVFATCLITDFIVSNPWQEEQSEFTIYKNRLDVSGAFIPIYKGEALAVGDERKIDLGKLFLTSGEYLVIAQDNPKGMVYSINYVLNQTAEFFVQNDDFAGTNTFEIDGLESVVTAVDVIDN